MSASKSDTKLKSIFLGLFEKTTLIGLTCGAFLGASSVFYRGASLSLENTELSMRAAFALTVSLIIQSIIMGIYLKVREPGQITKIFQNWPPSLTVGISGVLGSICWFTAFTVQNAAYVRALGQIELIFTFIASIVFFKEKTKINEFIGILLIAMSIIILLLN
uniref:Permeases of the drug/metabolite transporter (DMT) superfamily n=1 Tax=uncultured nuHF1 cluster bacterium HF0770_35I22 TaxID=723586 RepID=E7C7N5_9BACT|nr:permeases of the drug/metabolite transporter (DMT) superfamily [uncultured nuHF1 cluster bacterium HF0770_35I22]